jgi:hypothetical protein
MHILRAFCGSTHSAVEHREFRRSRRRVNFLQADLGLTTVGASMNPLGNDPERQSEAMGQKMPLSCHDAAVVGQPRGDGRSALPAGDLCERHVLRIP